MKKIVLTIFLIIGIAFSLEEPTHDVISLNDWLDSHKYTARGWSFETQCFVYDSDVYYNDGATLRAYSVKCPDNSRIGYDMPQYFGELEKHSTHVINGNTYVTYMWYHDPKYNTR